jgi:uncharacterized protein (TIGR00661 family)
VSGKRAVLLVGVCGIGHGHAARQLAVVEAARRDGWTVYVAGFGTTRAFFSRMGIPTLDTWAPILRAGENGLDWPGAVRANAFGLPVARRIWQRFVADVRDLAPDVIVTDYDPMSARAAYRLGIPLVTIDQQSKYRHFDLRTSDGARPVGEKRRLELFFPRFAHAFVCSFFHLGTPSRPGVRVVPSPVAESLREPSAPGDHALVYLSDYLGERSLDRPGLLAVLNRLGHRQFRCYGSALSARQHEHHRNVMLCPPSRDAFLADLRTARFVVANAGHTLMGEALAAGIPYLACPLPTFDQRFCAEVLERHGLGARTDRLDAAAIGAFEEMTDGYRHAIATSRILLRGDPLPTILETLRECAGV